MLLKEWYRLDRNARTSDDPPGVWLLKPRTEPPYDNQTAWEALVERPLREILAEVTAELQLAEDEDVLGARAAAAWPREPSTREAPWCPPDPR